MDRDTRQTRQRPDSRGTLHRTAPSPRKRHSFIWQAQHYQQFPSRLPQTAQIIKTCSCWLTGELCMVWWTGPDRTRPDDSRSYHISHCRLWKKGKSGKQMTSDVQRVVTDVTCYFRDIFEKPRRILSQNNFPLVTSKHWLLYNIP